MRHQIVDVRCTPGFILLVLASCSTAGPVTQESSKIPDYALGRSHPIPRVTVERLVAERSADLAAFREKYLHRMVEVVGRVGLGSGEFDSWSPDLWLWRIFPSSRETCFHLRLTGSLPTIHGVDCFFLNDQEVDSAALLSRFRQRAVLRGTLKGGGHPFFFMEECRFLGWEETFPEQNSDAYSLVAGFLGSDRKTSDRMCNLLDLNGIQCVIYGSVGYSVSVLTRDAPRARALLRHAIQFEGLRAGVYEETEPPSDTALGTVEVTSPEYEAWRAGPLNASRTFRVTSGTGALQYTDHLKEKTPSFVVLERSMGKDKWTVKIFAQITRNATDETERHEGDEELLIGKDRIRCHWIRSGPQGAWEKTWLTSTVPGGWAKKQRRELGTDALIEETVFEYALGK